MYNCKDFKYSNKRNSCAAWRKDTVSSKHSGAAARQESLLFNSSQTTSRIENKQVKCIFSRNYLIIQGFKYWEHCFDCLNYL